MRYWSLRGVHKHQTLTKQEKRRHQHRQGQWTGGCWHQFLAITACASYKCLYHYCYWYWYLTLLFGDPCQLLLTAQTEAHGHTNSLWDTWYSSIISIWWKVLFHSELNRAHLSHNPINQNMNHVNFLHKEKLHMKLCSRICQTELLQQYSRAKSTIFTS